MHVAPDHERCAFKFEESGVIGNLSIEVSTVSTFRKSSFTSRNPWECRINAAVSLEALVRVAASVFPIAYHVGHRNHANAGPAGAGIEDDDAIASVRSVGGRKIDADLCGPLARFAQQLRRRSGAQLHVLTELLVRWSGLTPRTST